MSGPAFKVVIPEWDDARIEAIAEAMLHLLDDEGVMALMDAEQSEVGVLNTEQPQRMEVMA